MAEYFEKEKLCDWCLNTGPSYCDICVMNRHDLPAADVRPVVRGKWEVYDELIKDLREWPRVCVEYTGSLDELHDKAADAIDDLQKRVPKRPHGDLVDRDALIEDLKYDVELDAIALDSMEIVGDERRTIQDDKDFKQNCIFWIENAPTVIEAEEGE